MTKPSADLTPSLEERVARQLLEQGRLTAEQLEQARELWASSRGATLGEVLARLGAVPEEEFTRCLAAAHRLRFIEPEEAQLDLELLERIPRQVIERHLILPLKGEHGVLLALTDPNDFQAIDEVQFLTNRPVETALASRGAVRRLIHRHYQRLEGQRRLGLKPDEKLSREQLAIVHMPLERLLKALVLTWIEQGQIDQMQLLANAIRVERELGVRPAPRPAGSTPE